MGTVVGTDNAAGNVATLTVTWPTVSSGDIAVLFWSHSSTATRTTTPSAAGFSNPLTDRTDGSEVLSYWEKTCTGSESGNFSVSMSGGTRQVLNLLVIRGYSSRDAGASNADAGTDANHTAPSVTPTVSGGGTVVASGERVTSGSTSATPATDYTVATQNSAVGTGGNFSQISYKGSAGTLTDDGVASTPISPGTWVHNVAASDVSMFTLYFGPSSVSITVDDATHAHAAESPALTQVHEVTPADAAHAHTAESPALTQVHDVAPADGVHAHTAESPTVDVSVSIAPDDATSAHSAESPAITQIHVVAPADGTHAHGAESPEVTQVHAVAPADASHAHSAESPTLTQTHVITPADAAHAHSAESPTVDVNVPVSPAGATHAHTAESPSITQVHVITVADALSAHAAESPTLTQLHLIAPADALHAHAAESPAIVQTHVIAPADALSGHVADEPTVAVFLAVLGRASPVAGRAASAAIDSAAAPQATPTTTTAPRARITE